MPRTSATAVPRRIWGVAALVLSSAVHLYVLERLLNLKPEAGQPKPVRALLPEEWVYEFQPPPEVPELPAAAPIPAQPPPQPAAARPQAAAAALVQTPSEIELEHDQFEYVPPAPRAADLLRQIPHAASQALPKGDPSERRWLDLGVRADAESGPIRPQRRSAGLGGAPTRGDMAPVGDIANGLLTEQWQQMHHPQENRSCARRAPDEPLSVFLGRCKQGL